MALRAHAGDRLAGMAFVVRCRAYGQAVFDSPVFRVPIDLAGLSSYIWIRAGVCAEGVANPGFVVRGFDECRVIQSMIEHLRATSCGVVVVDSPACAPVHQRAQDYPYVADGTLDLSQYADAGEYIASHANLKHKMKEFARKGGTVEVLTGSVPESLRGRFLACMQSTVDRSLVYSPFQGLFPGIVAQTSAIELPAMVHVVARLHGTIAGYHSFVESGEGLRMIHGAFDRTMSSTHHAYENLIVEAAGYAYGRGLRRIHFGPIMNETKRRMMNGAAACRIYFHSRFGLVRLLFPPIFRRTKMQAPSLLAFRASEVPASAPDPR